MNLIKMTAQNAGLFAEIPPEVFADNDLFLGVGCLDDDGEPIGAAILDADEDRLVISSIYVDEAQRRKGAGSLLLAGIREMAAAAGLSSVEAYFKEEEYEDFFLQNGYLVFQGDPLFRFSVSELLKGLNVQDIQTVPANCVKLGELKPYTRGELIRLLHSLGYVSRPSYYDRQLSFVYVKKDGLPTAFVFVSRKEEENLLSVDLLVNTENGHPENARKLIEALVIEAMEMVTINSRIELVAGAESVLRFMRGIIKGKKEIEPRGYLRHAVLAVSAAH